MSTYAGTIYDPPSGLVPFGQYHLAAGLGTVYDGGAAPPTYYYRTSLGVAGSTTSASAIPAGALVERVA